MAPSVPRCAGRSSIGTLAIVLLSGTAVAQTGETHRHTATPAPNAGAHSAPKNNGAADPSHAVHDAMCGAMSANPHLRMSPERAATAVIPLAPAARRRCAHRAREVQGCSRRGAGRVSHVRA